MKRYKQPHATRTAANSSMPEVIKLDGFLDALEYLSEREQTILTQISDGTSREGFLLISFDMTARLFMQISALIPSPVLKISVLDGRLRIFVSDKESQAVPERISLKLAKAAFLAGFGIEPDEYGFSLTASVSHERELAVYALSRSGLIEAFKKYFKK